MRPKGNHPTVIGIAGTFASGKDTVARHLVAKFGYTHISTGDILREETRRRYGSIERPLLHKFADELRHTEGAGALVERGLAAYRRDPQGRGVLFTGLRSLGEAKAIKAAGGTMLFIDAPLEARYRRMQFRKRDNETMISLQDFKAREAAEWHEGDDDAAFNLRDLKATAYKVIENTGSRARFIQAAERALGLETVSPSSAA